MAPHIMQENLSIRTNPANLNHHLWNNNGTWFIHYVVHPTPLTKERVRKSLGTKDVTEARERRDAILAGRVREGVHESVAGATMEKIAFSTSAARQNHTFADCATKNARGESGRS